MGVPVEGVDETVAEYAHMAHWATVGYDAEVPDLFRVVENGVGSVVGIEIGLGEGC
jgi:hypothetical protein